MLKNYVKLIIAILFASNVMAQNIPSYVPKDGLVGWWPFNGNANDESGNGNDLKNINGVEFSEDRLGKIKSAALFNGNQKLIKENPNFFNGNNERTISFWINQKSDIKSSVSIINIYTEDGCYTSSSIETYNNSNIYFWKRCDDINWNTSERKNNEWYHIVLVYSNNNLKLYINNNLEEIKNFYSNNMNTIPSFFNVGGGRNSDGNNGFWNGKIDDISIFNRALNLQEIQELYGGCQKEVATMSSVNNILLINSTPISLTSTPSGGFFSGEAVSKDQFFPNKAKLGKNLIKYNFINSKGCKDSTNFYAIVADTNSCNKYDTILKINFKLTTGIKAGQQTSMNVYPNPATDVLIIEANDIQALGGYKYKIVDLQGKEVYNALATSARTEISLKTIGAKGMYILHIVDEKGVSIENKKIVLE